LTDTEKQGMNAELENVYFGVNKCNWCYELLAYWERETRVQQCLFMKGFSTVVILGLDNPFINTSCIFILFQH